MPVLIVIILLFLVYPLMFFSVHWLGIRPRSTLMSHFYFIYALKDKVGLHRIMVYTVGNHLSHFNGLPVSEASNDFRLACLRGPISEPPLCLFTVILSLVMLDDVFIFLPRELSNTLGPDEKCQDIVTADIAFVCPVSLNIPLSSPRHELFVPKLTLYNQLLSFRTDLRHIRRFVDT